MGAMKNNSEDVLTLQDMSVVYDGKTELNDLNLSVKRGEILAIIGKSGSGKTTVLRSVYGVLGAHGEVVKGDILFQGESILTLSQGKLHALHGEGIELVMEHDTGSSFDPVENIEDHLYHTVRSHRDWTREEVHRRALDYLDKMEIPDGEALLKKYPFELTPGMHQRINIMMAMILDPTVLLVDDVTTELDTPARKKVLDLLLRVRRIYGTTILLVTHRIDTAEQMADKVAVMKGGHVIEYGTPDQVLHHPQHTYTKELIAEAEEAR